MSAKTFLQSTKLQTSCEMTVSNQHLTSPNHASFTSTSCLLRHTKRVRFFSTVNITQTWYLAPSTHTFWLHGAFRLTNWWQSHNRKLQSALTDSFLQHLVLQLNRCFFLRDHSFWFRNSNVKVFLTERKLYLGNSPHYIFKTALMW